MSRRAARLAALAGLFFFVSAGQAEQAAPRIAVTARPIEQFDPREPERRQFGALEFRGGVELSSADKRFGGLSSIRVGADGVSFLAVTDKANWLRGRIAYRGDVPVGISNAEIAPMLASDGKPITERGWYDSEGLAEDGGIFHVSLERVHRILRFDIGRGGLSARGQPVATPAGMASLPSNRGVECLVAAPKAGALAGGLIAISEKGLDDAGNIRGFIIGGRMPGEIAVARKGDFDVVDCAVTPGGGFLLLERFFSWRTGLAFRIRHFPLSAIRPGAVLDGPVLIEADLGYQIDNMEGLSVHRAADGDLVLTLVSDDNFAMIQRTILLQFTLREP